MTKQTLMYGAWPVVALAIATALFVASTVSAQATRLAGPHEAKIDAKHAVERVEAAGYTNVHDLEWDDGGWELEATSPDGTPVDVVVDATSGEVLHEEDD